MIDRKLKYASYNCQVLWCKILAVVPPFSYSILIKMETVSVVCVYAIYSIDRLAGKFAVQGIADSVSVRAH